MQNLVSHIKEISQIEENGNTLLKRVFGPMDLSDWRLQNVAYLAAP